MNDSLSLTTRREFLRSTMLGSAMAWTVPTFLSNTFSSLHAEAADALTQPVTGRDGTILVVLQMAGGNDGLNTVVPFTNDHYHASRRSLALSANKVLKLNDSLGLHPGLNGFKSLYDSGQLGIVQGVGYPNPNRSHFRSTEIWQTASDAQRFEKYGWIGRYFDSACAGADPTVGVNVGRQMPQAFSAKKPMGISLDNPQSYRFVAGPKKRSAGMDSTEKTYRDLNLIEEGMETLEDSESGGSIGALAGATQHQGPPLEFIERTAMDAQVSSDQIMSISKRVENQASYPSSRLGSSLKLVARLIGGGLPTRIFYVSQGGYDTHTNQAGAHERLLRDLGDSVKAFTDDLKKQGNFPRVVIMTFSEFGRRVSENANGGTDHGAAAPMFLVGEKVRSGLLGEYPSLDPKDLFNGDLKFKVDFRTVYAGILEQWLKTRSEPVLGRKFTPLTVV